MLEIYFILMVAILTWYNYGYDLKLTRKLRSKHLDFKPFNCLWCLSFWTGVIASITTLNIIYLSLPLATYHFNDDK